MLAATSTVVPISVVKANVGMNPWYQCSEAP